MLIFDKTMRLIKRHHITHFTSSSDSELISGFKQSHEPEIIGELYRRYHHQVYGICLKYLKDPETSADAVLQLFTDLFENLIKYEIGEFKNWMLTITRNYCLRQIKLENRYMGFSKETMRNLQTGFMENESEIAQLKRNEVLLDRLEESLNQLKPEQQQCMRLFYLEEKSYLQITELTGFHLKKVKSYIQNGKRNLQLIMNQYNDNHQIS